MSLVLKEGKKNCTGFTYPVLAKFDHIVITAFDNVLSSSVCEILPFHHVPYRGIPNTNSRSSPWIAP